MSFALKIDHLVKTYGTNPVIKDISFTVNRGEIFGFLGTNGAGKTTTLECIEGIRNVTSGSIVVDGKVGVQLQSSSLPASMKAIEAIQLFCRWNQVPVNVSAMDTFGISELKNKQYKEMSMGQKRRLHIVLAMIGDHDILFLDEPTAGLDVEGRVLLHEEIRKLKQKGKTIIMASHDMAEVESLCDRIAILKNGKIAYMGIPNELTRDRGDHSRMYVKTTFPLKIQELSMSHYNGEEQGYSLFETDNIGEALLELLTIAKKQQADVLDIKIERATLEQRFMDIAKEAKA
ncbi:ABC transporter ATP-binding protein [Ectobacillus sp. sgz5001026]|uniref:ABC transporter ATP-binding protein n=1 Tax=Ectobacillus sp. sgz5001026 TaxID=3242473 RepID=UPI0036D2FD73